MCVTYVYCVFVCSVMAIKEETVVGVAICDLLCEDVTSADNSEDINDGCNSSLVDAVGVPQKFLQLESFLGDLATNNGTLDLLEKVSNIVTDESMSLFMKLALDYIRKKDVLYYNRSIYYCCILLIP